MFCGHTWLTLKPFSLKPQKTFGWVLHWAFFFFFKFRLEPWSKMSQQSPPLPSCEVKDRADAKWREKSLFWQQAKGRRPALAVWGCGTAPGSLPPSVSHCSPMMATACWGGGAAAETLASPLSREAMSRRKVLQHIWTLTVLPTSPHKRSFLLQEGEQVGALV